MESESLWRGPTLCTAAFLAAYEAKEGSFIVNPILPAGSIAVLHGKRWTGKSQVAMTLAAAVGSGVPFLERYGTTKSPVTYVSIDMPFVTLQDRVRRGISALREVEFLFCPNPLDVTNPNGRGGLGFLADRPGLIIVDSLRKSHKLNENDSNTPSAVYGAWKELVHPESALLFLHHDRKTQQNASELDPDEAFRGSGAFLDDAYCGMHLTKTGKSSLLLTFTKVQGAGEQEPISLGLDEATLLMNSKERNTREVMAALRAANPTWSQVQLCGEVMRRTGCTKQNAYKLFQEIAKKS